jgi:hypothetical protein
VCISHMIGEIKVDCYVSVEVVQFLVVTRQKSGRKDCGVTALKMVVAEPLKFSESYGKGANDIPKNNRVPAS